MAKKTVNKTQKEVSLRSKHDSTNKNKSGLTPMQELFVREYAISLNATDAAKRAGYSEDTSGQLGWQLLQIPLIRSAIETKLKSRFDTLDITGERILKELSYIAFGRMTDIAEWNQSGVTFKDSAHLTEEAAASVSEVEETTNEYGGSLKVKQHNKTKALELLAKHKKLLTEKVEHSVDITLEQLIAGSQRNEKKGA